LDFAMLTDEAKEKEIEDGLSTLQLLAA
jgi:hypothetical protein